jgi:hypothetical protein
VQLPWETRRQGRLQVDLKDFVAGSLAQIVEGIRQAQKDAGGSGAWIGPTGSNIAPRADTPRIKTETGEGFLHEVHFDVAVTVSDEQSAGGGAGLRVSGAKLGTDGNVTCQNAAVSRVQFSVPIVWPGQSNPELEKRLEQERRSHDEKVRAHSTGSRGRGPYDLMKR